METAVCSNPLKLDTYWSKLNNNVVIFNMETFENVFFQQTMYKIMTLLFNKVGVV
jgi:hypothetical protein